MSTEAPARSVSAIALMVSGAAILLAIVVFVTAAIPDSSWLYLLSYAAMAVALVMLAREHFDNGTAKVCALFAALGWVFLIVVALFSALPGIVSSTAYFVIFASSIATAAVVFATQQLTSQARLSIVAMLTVTALYMASAFFAIYGPLAALLTILLGLLAVLSGYLLATRR